MRDCFVTGATGHIGNVLVKKLLERGDNVTVMCLPHEDIEPIKDLKLNIVWGNIMDREFLFDNIKKGQIVFHLAAAIAIDDDNKESYHKLSKINVDGTKNIVDACIRNNAKKLIYTSSVHIIEPKKNVLLKEPDVFDENKVFGSYAKTKVVATKYILDKAKEGLIDAVVVYPSGVIGPFDYRISEIGQVVLDHINAKLLGYVKGGYNFADVRDVASGIINAAEYGKSGEGYILSGKICSIKEMIQILNSILGRKRLPSKFSLVFLKIFAKLSNAYYKIRGKKPVFSKFSLSTLNTNANFDNTKAVQELKFKSRSLFQSFKDSIDWFIKHKKDLIDFKKIKNYVPCPVIALA